VGAEIELARMEEVNSNLTDQLRTRKVVERAKGILQRELRLNEEQAYLALQKQSRQKRKAMKEIAEAIILGTEVRETSGRRRGVARSTPIKNLVQPERGSKRKSAPGLSLRS
jgi:hypothetical protein